MQIQYSKQAIKTISGMTTNTKARIRQGIIAIPKGDIKQLKGSSSTYRLRIGDWRILFSYKDDATIVIEKIAPRGEAYKGA